MKENPIYQTISFDFRDVEHAKALFGLRELGNLYIRIYYLKC
jgi:O-acetylhomoserine (thiol)-lyase